MTMAAIASASAGQRLRSAWSQAEGSRPTPLHHRAKELRLDRGDGDEAPVGAFIAAVERRSAVEQVAAALERPAPGGEHAVDHRHLAVGAVDHRGVDHLPLAGPAGMDQRRDDPEGRKETAAAVIADKVQRRLRRAAGLAHRRQRTRERDIGQVVAGGAGPRALLSPAGDPAIDQPRVAREDNLGAKPQPLHDAGPQALDQRIGPLEQRERVLPPRLALEVERHRRAPPVDRVLPGVLDQRPALGVRAGDPHNVGAEIGQQHPAIGRRPDPLELDHSGAGQRSRHRALP